ncbi:glycosyltransferase [Methylocystis sp. 9N]|uniref:Glycosyltransferase n=1 Tax=Methylocystis borbori TaxID=3118750 RepID=A0ABU7XEN6_9HYPH
MDMIRKARVCILTPGQIGSNPRVVKEAQTLQEAGFDAMVIATRMLDRIEPRDQSIMRNAPWRLRRIDLTSKWRWKARRVLQFGLRGGYMASKAAWLADIAFSAATLPLRRAALQTPAELYIAHYPAALPAAAAAARRHGGRYAYDAEDFHLGDWSDAPSFKKERELVRAIEARHLPGCAYVTAASPGIADAYRDAYGIERPRIILNAFPLEQAPIGSTEKGTAEPGPSVYWFSQTIGPDRGLECAVRAIGRARMKPHLYLRGSPAGGFIQRLRAIAAEAGVMERIHILPPEAPERMERLAAGYDLGLAAEIDLVTSRKVALTNKLFSYLLAGVPPIMSDTPAQRAFAAEAGLSDQLYPIDDSAALAAVLDSFLGDPIRLAAARERAYRLGQERFNWRLESVKLLSAVSQAVGAAGPALCEESWNLHSV